jgi:hypothetical protein
MPLIDSTQQTEAWAAAKVAYEQGASLRETARVARVSHETVRVKANKEGWTRDGKTRIAEAAARQQRTAAARQELNRRWATRRAAEADAAGIVATAARQRVLELLRGTDEKMLRAAVQAYGVLVQSAQLLSGGATARIEDQSAAELRARADRIIDGARDELAARREVS